MQNAIVITPVILSGGSGTRLWPLSRTHMPKQFVKVSGDTTLFESTLERMQSISNQKPVVVTNAEHRFLVGEQLRSSSYRSGTVIIEPTARNTAPAIMLAALQLVEDNPDTMMLICPADHAIGNVEAFKTAVSKAVPMAKEDSIVTFGITPDHAATGYGYIEVEPKDHTRINEFVEKPDEARATEFVASGKHFWNSGIFLVKARFILDQLQLLAPAIHAACLQAWAGHKQSDDFITVDKHAFFSCPNQSIDYAVMEKTTSARMIPLDCSWTDLGTWDSIWRQGDKDASGNVSVGDVKLLESSNNYVRSRDKLVAIVGCDDLTVIESGDTILVAKRESTAIKSLVDSLIAENRKEALHHSRVFRPWGNYEGVVKGDRYQVKRIVVTPGEQLSLQKHYHRAEHWIVVRGIALITCGDEEKLVGENQSTYIPLGQTHRLENPGKIPLELIEVQSGSYLGEDDIVRFDDKYGRRESDRKPNDSMASTPLKQVG